MSARGGIVLTLMLLTAGLAGCLGSDPVEPQLTDEPADAPAWTPCEHPWPCADGSEWPLDLTGPFDLLTSERVRVTSHDGVVLHGWVLRPDTAGVPVPTIIHSTPYAGQNHGSPEGGGYLDRMDPGARVLTLLEAGYAVVVFQVRGSGLSGGCLDWMSSEEQRDQAILVDWVASQEWSNGRVAMSGISWHGTTPIQAAVDAPEALKTIMAAGIGTDLYLYYASPQGALRTIGVLEQATFYEQTTPPEPGTLPATLYPEYLSVAPDRACPGLPQALTSTVPEMAIDDRDEAFWDERRLTHRLSDIRAAVLHTQGFHDSRGHAYQDTWFWEDLPADTPKYFIKSQASHEYPSRNSYEPDWALDDWEQTYLTWMDFWLKGIGPAPPGLGTVEFQDDTGAWHNTTAWPPTTTTPQAFYLTPDGLTTAPSDQETKFDSIPDYEGASRSDNTVGYRNGEQAGPMCPHPTQPPNAWTSYETEPLTQDTLLAGNPVALLNLASTEPGGLVHLALLDLGPDHACNEDDEPTDVEWIAQATADLRFHDGSRTGHDFPVDTPTPVRFDLTDAAAVVEEGHRLAVYLSYGDPGWRGGQPHPSTVTIGGDSVIVLPLDQDIGLTDGELRLPARPFAPG